MTEEDVLLAIERDSAANHERVRALLLEAGRPDLLAEMEANLRDVRLGLTGARSVWHSISSAQRKVLSALSEGRWLTRCSYSKSQYDALGEPHALSRLCGIKTARALCARDLLACDGTTFDPEQRFALTEHGRFVVKHGAIT